MCRETKPYLKTLQDFTRVFDAFDVLHSQCVRFLKRDLQRLISKKDTRERSTVMHLSADATAILLAYLSVLLFDCGVQIKQHQVFRILHTKRTIKVKSSENINQADLQRCHTSCFSSSDAFLTKSGSIVPGFRLIALAQVSFRISLLNTPFTVRHFYTVM